MKAHHFWIGSLLLLMVAVAVFAAANGLKPASPSVGSEEPPAPGFAIDNAPADPDDASSAGTTNQAIAPVPDRATVVPDTAAVAYREGAALVGCRVYAPATIPAGFTYLGAESTLHPDLVGIVYAKDDARILVLQGAFDVGEGPERVEGLSASFGPLEAAYYTNARYAWQPESPVYGVEGEAVLAGDGAASYELFGSGVSREDLLAIAASMRLVQ